MKLIALDLDGTTVNSQNEISEENINAIKKAQEQGHIVMLLSGRSASSILLLLDDYGLNCPVGGDNGTSVFVDGELIHFTGIPQAQNQQITSMLEKELIPYKIATNKGEFAHRDWSNRLETILGSGRVPEEHFTHDYFEKFTRHPEKLNQNFYDRIEDVLENEEILIQKYFVLGFDPDQKKQVQEMINSLDEIHAVESCPFSFDVMHVNGHKGNGLLMVANHFNIPIEDTVAIGDEGNDIAMFKMAGLSIAMGNATDEVKALCDHVTLTNNENGVAYAIENFILNR